MPFRGGFKTKNRSNFGIRPNLRWPPAPLSTSDTLSIKKYFCLFEFYRLRNTTCICWTHAMAWLKKLQWTRTLDTSLTFIISLSFYYFFNFQICLLLVDLPVNHQQLSCVWYIICNDQLERWPSSTNTLQERSECQQDK